MYSVGKSIVVSVVHQGIEILRKRLTPNAILFPMASELQQVMVDFEALCGLPCCAGALDSTFITIKKPEEFGDTFFCYIYRCWDVWMPGGFSHMLTLEDLDQLVSRMRSTTAFCMKRFIMEKGLHMLQH